MRRFLPLLAAMMLAVMLWSGNAAQAAEAFGCIEVGADAAGHFDGDSDQVPSDSEKGTMHHHGGCHGHHSALADDMLDAPSCISPPANPGAPAVRFPHGADPGMTLRPPIA
jgi:hypothetical protein